MPGTIAEIIDELVEIQKGIAAPAGEKKLAHAFDELPAQVTEYPSFVTLEDGIPEIRRGAGVRKYFWQIAMHLLLAPGEQKGALRARRLWVPCVLDAFDRALVLNLNQSPVQYAPISNVTFEPFELSATEYVTATFWISAQTAEAFAPEP